MNRNLIVICCALLVFAGCKENDVPLVFKQAVDSTYVLPAASIPPPDAHNVLVEEFTGQSCSNCPAAHALLDGIAGSGHVIVMGLYVYNFSQTTPPPNAIYDFRDSAASQISNDIYGNVVGYGIPSGGVDRVSVSGQMLLYSGQWSGAINTRKAVTDSINLSVESSYDGSTATIKATVTYLQPTTLRQNISVAIVEDSMVDVQETPTGYNNAYTFTRVLKKMLTSRWSLGDAVLPTMATKEAGRVYWQKFKYTPGSNIVNPAHCRVVAYLTADGAGGDYHVIQSAQTNLVP